MSYSEMSDERSDHYLPDSPRPLWLTWATMCTYRVQTFNFFKIILSAFENWQFKQSLTKMIARWMPWQDFPLKRKLYFPFHWDMNKNTDVHVVWRAKMCMSFFFFILTYAKIDFLRFWLSTHFSVGRILESLLENIVS